MVHGLFVEEEARKVLSIPLASIALEDRWRWYPNEDDIYTIQSGYWLLLRNVP